MGKNVSSYTVEDGYCKKREQIQILHTLNEVQKHYYNCQVQMAFPAKEVEIQSMWVTSWRAFHGVQQVTENLHTDLLPSVLLAKLEVQYLIVGQSPVDYQKLVHY